MSLRKSICLTSRRLDATRRNAQRSTGPRSEAGKLRMRMNALKHGCDAAPENEAEVMRALGEDPERYEALKRELATAYGPGDALWHQQLADLAKLYWRRNRLERMETGLMRDALEKVEEGRRQLARALADVTFEPSQCDAVALDLPHPKHPCVRRRMLISLWGVIREQVRRRVFTLAQQRRIESYYQGELGWRPRQIGHLLGLFKERPYLQQQDQAEYVKETFGDQAGMEARYQELVGLLEEQIAAEEAALAEEMAGQEKKDAIARDACLAPEDETANMVLRLEAGLDRAIDRKVRILLTLRKEPAGLGRNGSRTARRGTPWRAPTREASPPEDEPHDHAAGADTPSSVCDSGEEGEAGPSLGERQSPNGRGLRPPTSGTESQAEEDGEETSKSPEQSQNVDENKAPAREEVNA